MAVEAAQAKRRSNPSTLAPLNDDCPICLEEPKRPLQLPCGHIFCADCLLRDVMQSGMYSERRCPLCRGKLFTDTDEYEPSRAMEEDTEFHRHHRLSGFLCGWFFYCSIS